MNYYEILGVDRKVTAKELKHAYKALARKWHPDLNPDNLQEAERKMTEINVAYSVLSDDVARMDYDKKLDAEFARGARQQKSADHAAPKTSRRQSSEHGADAAKVDFGNINSTFESFFGFDPKSKEVTNEDKLNTFARDRKKKNPLDTTDFFERFMGLKK